jgi:hypothetical protein
LERAKGKIVEKIEPEITRVKQKLLSEVHTMLE